MSGRKFFLILSNLHCCSMDNQPVGDAYDPSYKIAEMKVQTDCFTVVHESERMREVVMKQYEKMKKFTPSKNKN